MKKLGIIGAMTVEVETLKNIMTDRECVTRAGIEFCSGNLEGMPAVIAQCGVGKVNAAMCTQILCSVYGVTHLVNTGIAGSLCAELDIADMVVSTDAMYHDVDVAVFGYPAGQVPGMPLTYPADETLRGYAFAAAEAVNPGHTRTGRVASGDQFISGKEQKEKIIADTSADCTEMEGASIAHTAWRNNVPFVILRAISDKADDSAQMDYPTFEAIAAQRCAKVTSLLARALNK